MNKTIKKVESQENEQESNCACNKDCKNCKLNEFAESIEKLSQILNEYD
jgi:hypothetical protein